MSSGPSDDPALLARARRGDAEAFRVIFRLHAPAVRRFLGNLCRDDSEADEATQETFVRAHAKLTTLRDDARLRGWLLGIARLVGLDALAARRREVPTAAPIAQEQLDGFTPESTLLSAEAEGVLAKALARLSAERRAALLLRLDHRLDYGDIAQAMGWPLHKVKNEIHRARLELRVAILPYLRGTT